MSTPEALFISAKSFLSSDLGITDTNILADNFVWVGPNVVSTGVLNKEEYLAAGKYFNLRAAFPDLDYRAHDFRLANDNDDENELDENLATVRFTARTVGTMRGRLRLRGEIVEPNGKRMVCPPEAISVTFDKKTGKVVKLVSGFCMDRLVGNTGGLCGVQAAATIAGIPPSEWEIYPPATVLSRFFGRSVKQIKEPETVFLAPFPETVMIQLAKGVLASELGTKDPDLLSDSFTFCGPLVGPLDKTSFIDAFSSFNIREALPDLEENYSNFRVDPYDPYRIWYDVQGSGTRTGMLGGKEGNGAKYQGPPEASSMTFDDDGFCTRLTAGAVMDPTIGNTGGLGGVFGIFYATGVPLPAIASRTISQIVSRVKTDLLSPFTGKKADDLIKCSKYPVVESKEPPSRPDFKVPSPPLQTSSKEQPITPKPPPVPPLKKLSSTSISMNNPPKKEEKVAERKPPQVKSSPTINKLVPTKKASDRKVDRVSISDSPTDSVSDVFSNLFGSKKDSSAQRSSNTNKSKTNTSMKKSSNKQIAQATEKTKQAEARKNAFRIAAENAKKKAQEKKNALEAKKKEANAAAENAKMLAKEKKEALEAKKREAKEAKEIAAKSAAENAKRLAQEKREALEAKRKEAQAKKQATLAKTTANQKISSAKPGATISLGLFKFNSDKQPDMESDGNVKAPVKNMKRNTPEKRMDVSASAEVEKTLSKAKRGATISLGIFSFGQNTKDDTPKVDSAVPNVPKGVPRLAKWKQNSDGSITGTISESSSFRDGESITTSPLKTKEPLGNSIVVTVSGSRYYLEGDKVSSTEFDLLSVFGRTTEPQRSLEGDDRNPVAKKKQVSTKTSSPIAIKQPPKGVPIMNKFKKNRDGSITGFISGSKNFEDGEQITTSKLAPDQIIEAGNIVQTVSGSKYFLN
jgi:hypothetical protein